ncbi:substrate-binding domain-containing protein [Cellulosimicrobium sp. CUA-896]|uniref:substrate-binding domain-containing protein n=1 Tax=Cellulosimicrobium sp. CUA-896 TaxID=1517881 RepID=UPI00130134BE|nr:substrate-binding domain-containing protein [Cellulosimicrobium sp. CUA-896]
MLLVDYAVDVLDQVPPALTPRLAAIGPAARGVRAFDVDAAAGIAGLMRHVLDGGRRDVVMLAGPWWLPGTRRAVDAYGAVVADAGAPRRVVSTDLTARAGADAVREVRRRWPRADAVVAMSDTLALGALRALAEDGVAVPDDVAITGFDDQPFVRDVAPTLTTATHPVEEIAAAATAELLGRRRAERRTFPSHVVARATA